MKDTLKVQLVNSRGLAKEFPIKVAENALAKAEGQKQREQTHWLLPDNSSYTLRAGSLVTKAKKKEVD